MKPFVTTNQVKPNSNQYLPTLLNQIHLFLKLNNLIYNYWTVMSISNQKSNQTQASTPLGAGEWNSSLLMAGERAPSPH